MAAISEGGGVMSNAKLGTFKDLVDLTAPELRPVIKRLREVIVGIDPEACEVVRLGDRGATYGVGPRKMTEGYAYLIPHKSSINLGFYQGVSLPDPKSLPEGTGVKMRHVKIKTVKEAEAAGVRALIKAAMKERRTALKC